MPLLALLKRHDVLITAICWFVASVTFVARASSQDALNWLLAASVVCLAAFIVQQPLRQWMRRLPAGDTLTQAFGLVPPLLGVVGVLTLFVLDVPSGALGWLMIVLGGSLGLSLEARMPDPER